MNTIELNHPIDLAKKETAEKNASLLKRFADFAESQKDKRLGWFMVSLLAQSVLFLPVPAALMYYYDAPIWVLAVTVLTFFANIIAGMGGSKINVLIFLAGFSTLIHLAMIAFFVL
ncbi:MAG: hypothetical protein JSU01_10040 [Bacteroidetes bacterium]|nr:hypothetical protein [Bacteroidota bacterium]